MKWFRTSLYTGEAKETMFAVVEISAVSANEAELLLDAVLQGKVGVLRGELEPCMAEDEG